MKQKQEEEHWDTGRTQRRASVTEAEVPSARAVRNCVERDQLCSLTAFLQQGKTGGENDFRAQCKNSGEAAWTQEDSGRTRQNINQERGSSGRRGVMAAFLGLG